MELAKLLSQRIGRREIEFVAAGSQDDELVGRLYALSASDDVRVSYNALWVLTYLGRKGADWLQSKRDELISRVMSEQHAGKRRLILTLLRRLRFDVDSIRPDFIDYCFAKINSQVEPYASRALCLRLAFAQCHFYPELLSELRAAMEMMKSTPLSPGLKSAWRDVDKKIPKSC